MASDIPTLTVISPEFSPPAIPILSFAEFSVGALFDVRVEVHSSANASTDHSVTISKQPGGAPQSLNAFFGVGNTSSAPYTYSFVTDYSGDKKTMNVSINNNEAH